MVNTIPKTPRKRFFNRPILAVAAVIACTLLGWLGYYAYLDWADARALNEYLIQLEKREPNWRERVYGEPPTVETLQSIKQLVDLNKLITADMDTRSIDRGVYFSGLVQDWNHPASLFTAEQEQFLQWVTTHYQQVLEKTNLVEKDNIIPYYYDVSLSNEKRIEGAYRLISDTYDIHEILEVQFFHALQQNDSKQAVTYLVRLLKERRRKGRPEQTYMVNYYPSLVERLLNLTEPDDVSLLQLHAALQQYIDESRKQFLLIGARFRMMTKYVEEMSQADLTQRQLLQGNYDWLVPKESILRQAWLKSVFPWYANIRLKTIYRRTAYLTLKLHQLADQIESLALLPESERWPVWVQYSRLHQLPLNTVEFFKNIPPDPAILPEGLPHVVNPLTVSQAFEKLAKHRVALAIVLAERYRRAHGKLPVSWNDLVPEFIPGPLLDIFTGQPLIIKKIDDGILIYSLGPEEKDHLGSKLNSGDYWYLGSRESRSLSGNYGLRLHELDKRRLPPITLKQDAIDELNKWKAYEAAKKQKQNEKPATPSSP